MHVHLLRIKNFRRLKDVKIALARDISIFVGANNSGKTSASQAVYLFAAAARERFSIHDFNVESWTDFNAFGDKIGDAKLPRISVDLWFHVEETDIHRVIDLLPSLKWEGSLVGLRVEFAASDEEQLLARFSEAREKAKQNCRPGAEGKLEYHPRPRNLIEYLTDRLRYEFELRYYVLDPAGFDQGFSEKKDYVPRPLTSDAGRSGKDVLNSLVRVDLLNAQRHLSDSAGESRAEDLSRCLSRFYNRNLEKRENDYDAISALADSESMLNDHLARVFAPTLERLADLGYPGLTNPRLLIKSALNPAAIMSSQDGARVHYAICDSKNGANEITLPDNYNGLGFKNLIYMVVEILDLHARWRDVDEVGPPLHLVFIEEPEAHLHAQLQQVFIRKVLDLIAVDEADKGHYSSQLVVTTHSPHILYERGFQPIRYFRRAENAFGPSSEVLNLSDFYASFDTAAHPVRNFLERYLKLTHCDLFFADAAVLVEGNVERLLLPQMIETSAPRLKSCYLTILEIGGAFGFRFRSLIEFLGITALVITDIDSVHGGKAAAAEDAGEEDDDDEDADDESKPGSACMTNVSGAVTSNQTLIQWLPGKSSIVDLTTASPDDCIQPRSESVRALVRVTYQTAVDVEWKETKAPLVGRTLEEAFALENLPWCQHANQADLNLRIKKIDKMDLSKVAERLHKRVKCSKFNKTDFALGLLAKEPDSWLVPTYISHGLQWLQDQVAPVILATKPSEEPSEASPIPAAVEAAQ